jgi:hypothetical protein
MRLTVWVPLAELNAWMRCFACDASIEIAAGERVGFRDSCDRCAADLHVCRACTQHDPGAYNECREPNTEWVGDRERANRCEYFTPGEGRGGEAATEAAAAKARLEGLFKR